MTAADPAPRALAAARAAFARPGVAALVGLSTVGLWALRWPVLVAGDADLATHVRIGRELLATGWPRRVPLLEGEGPAWSEPVIVSEWGFDVGMALLEGALGWAGPLAVGLALGGLAFGGLAARVRAGGAGAWTLLLSLAVALVLSAHHVTTRPHLVTWALLVPWTAWWRAWAVGDLPSGALARRALPVAALWANVHGGFLAGVLYAGLMWLGAGAGRRLAGACLLAATVAATCVNPWGPGLWLELTGFLSDRFVVSGTSDFQPLGAPTMTALLVALGLALAVHLRDPLRARLDLLPLLVFGAAAVGSSRNVPIAMLALTAPAAAAGARLVRDRAAAGRRWAQEWLASEERLGGGAARAGLGWIPPLAVGVAVALAATGQLGRELPARLAPRAAWATVGAPDELVFTDFKMGGFVALWGGRPFVHPLNLLYPRERLEEYVVVNQALPGWRDVLARHGARWLLLAPDSPLAARLEAEPGCEVTHRDPVAVVARCDL